MHISFPYCFEGVMKVTCKSCKRVHELTFNGGNETNSIEEAIEDALTTDGWLVSKLICPECHSAGNFESEDEEDENDVDFFMMFENDDDE